MNQTISGLACGKPIKGKVAFLGGPLYFLSELRQRFIETLELQDEDIIFPDNSQLFVAMGAALNAKDVEKAIPLDKLIHDLKVLKDNGTEAAHTLEPLFHNEDELRGFRDRHLQAMTKKRNLKKYQGNIYVGIDVGSTTSKVVLIDDEGSILYSFYNSNEGNPLDLIIRIMKEIYDLIPEGCHIQKTGVTGYGEALIKAALKVDYGEVETIAHYTAAKHFEPDFVRMVLNNKIHD